MLRRRPLQKLLLPPPDKMSLIFDNASLVRSINPTLPEHPADRIRNGENPYKAMREFRGLLVKETAENMNREVEQYIAFETTAINMTREEVLGFCYLMRCWPYELHQEGRPLRPEIRDAMIHIVSNAEDYGFRGDGSMPCKKMHAILSKESSARASVHKMANWVISLSGQSHAKMVVDFLEELIHLDGSYQLRKIDNHVGSLMSNKIEFEKDKLSSLGKIITAHEENKTKVWKNLNQLGRRLYPTGQSDRPDWKEVFGKLQDYKSLHCGDDSKKTIDGYRRTPYSIGRAVWPAFLSTTVEWRGKRMPWDDARHIQADMLLDYWERSAMVNHQKYSAKNIQGQIDFFQIFIKEHLPVFHRFMNRQEIMHSMVVRSVMDEQLREARYQKPQIVSNHPVMRHFV